MQLTLKLVLAALVGITVVQAVNGYFRVQRELDLFESDLAGDLTALGTSVSFAMERAWRQGGEESALIVLDEMRGTVPHTDLRWVPRNVLDRTLAGQSSDVAGARSALERGQPVVYDSEHNHKLTTTTSVASVTSVTSRDRLVLVAVPLRPEGELEGVLELAGSLREQEAYVDRSVLTSVLSAAATLLATALILFAVGAFFVRRPIGNLIDDARRIGAGDLSRPIELPQRDEIGELARALDAMRADLGNAQMRVESEVRARTEAQVRAEIEGARRREAVDQLRHADRLSTVGRLASSMVHELGAPLQVIAGRARMIERDGEASGRNVENARIAREQSERITQLVRQLLDFSRKGNKPGDRALVEEVVARTTKLLEPIAAAAKVVFTVATDEPKNVVVRGDAAQLQQVLVNLAYNAIQAMPDGGTLTVRTAVDSKTARIEVEDTGVGMSDETRARIFTPFFTTKPAGQGTGLGLCVVDEIVKSCGGRVDVESTLGKGSRFRVELPLA